MTADTKNRRRATYDTSPTVYRIMRVLCIAMMHVLYRYTIVGRENVPSSGPLMLVVNHLHILDPAAVMPAVPRKIVTMAKEEWNKASLVGLLLRMAGVVFVRRGEVDRQALRESMAVLNSGGVLAIAPEGTRSKHAALQSAKPGIAYLALRSNATIVPVGFWGIERLGDWKRLRKPACHTVVGRPFRLPPQTGRLEPDTLQQFSDMVMLRLGALLPESYRGVYAERIAAVERGESQELAALIDV
ncbi:MAG: lysophospholipid acyltransferase family protein [Anaerolineae bacterium]